MASLQSRIVSFILRTTGIYRRQFAGGPNFPKVLEKARAAKLPVPNKKYHHAIRIEKQLFGERPVWLFAPKDGPKRQVLYWHGGGYIYTAAQPHLDFCCHMAAEYGWQVTMPLYPLAPEEKADSILDWAEDFYKLYTAALEGQPFVMGGDSAGGGLTAALTQRMRDAGEKLPGKLILICPWLNADPSHPDQPAIEQRDAILTLRGIGDAGRLYAGGLPLSDPAVSPIHGDWQDMPPILAFGGGDDILVTNARALKEKLPQTDYRELPQMIHDWPIFVFPESREAQKQMAEFAAEG